MSSVESSVARTLRSVRRLGRPAATSHTQCELCGNAIAAEHAHLVERSNGRLWCACQPCAILFGNQDGQRYCRVPSEVYELTDLAMDDRLWANLAIPIGLAFVFRSTASGGVVAVYPSPVGPLRSEPPSEAWEELVCQSATCIAAR